MLDHANEFQKFNITNDQLPKVAEAATKIGILGFLQGKRGNETDRPVFALNFYDKPLAVAVSVGNNGFVIGMNGSSLDKFKVKTKYTDEDLPPWPAATLEPTTTCL